MIELPHHFLNALFMILIVFAAMNRARQPSGAEKELAPQSVRFPRSLDQPVRPEPRAMRLPCPHKLHAPMISQA